MSKVSWRMKGQYIKNCNCVASCPCDTVGFPAPQKFCEGMAGMLIEQGNYGDVPLDGLKWAVTYHWPGALHEGNGTAQPFVDQKASEAQRSALLQIMSGQAGNAWFEVLASIITKFHDPQFLPITWDFDKKSRRARVGVAGFFETTSAPLVIPATDREQEVIVRMPNGMEYKEFAVAQAVVLKGTGPIKFDYKGTHSSLASVEHTQAGLEA